MSNPATGRLLDAATDAMARAYAPYSGFRVGAAALAGSEVFAGCNVENASYGLTICAERVAVFAAVAAGHRTIDALALTTDAARPTAPCGACRQVLYEFGPEMTVIMSAGGETLMQTLRDLLPLPFGPADLAGP